VPVPPSLLSAATRLQACPKLLSFSNFYKEQNSGQAFLNSCALYICLVPEQFSYEEEKVL